MDFNIDIQKVIKAASTGGLIAKRYFGKAIETKEKTHAADFVTKADVESETAIISSIEESFPSCNINSEEKGLIDKKSKYTFYIDPLDGTNNFALGIPHFSVSIGLLYEKEGVMGVVHNPILNETYYAIKGHGAFLKNIRLHVNKESDMKKASISYTSTYMESKSYLQRVHAELYLIGVKRIFDFWSPALEFCLLASGKIEGIINNGTGLHDYTVGKLIALEAGAKITNFGKKKKLQRPLDYFVISNQTSIHEQLLALVA